MIETFLQQAANGQAVYITDVREAFQARGRRPFHLHVTLYDRSVRAFPLLLPGEEAACVFGLNEGEDAKNICGDARKLRRSRRYFCRNHTPFGPS